MFLDTGYRCGQLSYLGLLPFEISNDYQELLNSSGFSGPISNNSDPRFNSFSGVIGPGTYYPASGTIDQICRMFWAVKSWRLDIKMAKVSRGNSRLCFSPSFGILPGFTDIISSSPYSTFSYCAINVFDGSFSSSPLFFGSYHTTLQDYCAYNSTTYDFGRDREGICPITEDNLIKGICVPLNPIQTFADLLCRKSYFTWSPKQEDWDNFDSGRFSLIKSPYLTKQTQITYLRPLPPGGYDCGAMPNATPVYSMFSLSIMDIDSLSISGSNPNYVAGYIPPNNNHSPYDCGGISGEVLTNGYGEIIGYGTNIKPSGINTPKLYDINTGIGNWPATGSDPRKYFPYINFQVKMKSENLANSSSNNCPINDTYTTIQTRADQQRVGFLKINDYISGFSSTALTNTRILNIPIYSVRKYSSESEYINFDVELTASDFWYKVEDGKFLPTY